MLFVEADAEDAILGLFFGGVEFFEGGLEVGFGHGGVGEVSDVKIGEELGEGLIAQEADDLGFEGVVAVGGKFDGVAELDLLAFFVVEPELDFFGAGFDVVEKLGL